MENREEKKDNPFYIAFILILLVGPWIAGPILFVKNRVLAGILVIVIPYAILTLIGFLRKFRQKRAFYRIKDAHTRFDILPVADAEMLKTLRENSALTFFGEPSDEWLDRLYNWLNNEGVLKEERLKLYTYGAQDLKSAFGKRLRMDDAFRLMSINLKDLDLNDSNKDAFSRNRMEYGGRWLDDIVANSK